MNCYFVMLSWGFLILSILIIHSAKADTGICGEKKQYTTESLKRHCKTLDADTPEDYEILRRGAANKEYGNCVSAFGFVAVLDNPWLPGLTCIGAIISHRWILDNCIESPEFQYQRITIGAMINPPIRREYNIQRTIQHEYYRRQGFIKYDYDKPSLFGARNSLFLRKTDTKMKMPRGVCRITLHSSKILPQRGAYVVYMNDSSIRSRVVRVAPTACCNHHFKTYFEDDEQMCLEDSQYCVSSKRFAPPECCHSQPLMIYDFSLVGIMSWSTGCSFKYGIDPWVFVHVAYYRDWVKNSTGL